MKEGAGRDEDEGKGEKILTLQKTFSRRKLKGRGSFASSEKPAPSRGGSRGSRYKMERKSILLKHGAPINFLP